MDGPTQAERDAVAAAHRAVAEERRRIARELHDVVAHSVSVMTVQAGAVRRLLGDGQERERQALEVVEATGRQALTEMRRLVGLLREQGANASAETLEASQYVALFTTVARARLSAARAIELYRVRWQLELQFKRWKSLCGLDQLPNYRDDTIRAWLYAKLLAALLVDRMMASAASPPTPPDTDLAYGVAA